MRRSIIAVLSMAIPIDCDTGVQEWKAKLQPPLEP
jgi:hypothetical protein